MEDIRRVGAFQTRTGKTASDRFSQHVVSARVLVQIIHDSDVLQVHVDTETHQVFQGPTNTAVSDTTIAIVDTIALDARTDVGFVEAIDQ